MLRKLRQFRWPLAIAYLILVGLIPAAATPVVLAVAGLGVIAAVIPGPAWIAGFVIAGLRHQPSPRPTA
ncbi:hypothetical protein ACL02U_11990 [Streptomyces sp. MS06]|uniref:hypothetical protein n=1 Tax=Streptomyces sp. MS06 TaxID=3385974 RepID=UPI0039A0D918